MSLNRYMHPRNIYRKPPDFTEIASLYKEFQEVSTISITGRRKIDFKDQKALRVLTQCLLHKDFNLAVNIPENKLVPTLPLRLNYILWLEDILKTFNFTNIRGIDIGCGASCIYGLLGAKNNGWEMIGTEVDEESIRSAMENVTRNSLENLVRVVEQKHEDNLFKCVQEISGEIHFSMCNPPFYDDFEEESSSNRTGTRDSPRSVNTGTGSEISVQGSEVSFVKHMIDESLILKDRIKIYTSMLGKKSSLGLIKSYLKERSVTNFISTEFCQGRTTRWAIAWSHVSGIYLNKVPQYERKKMKKPTGHSVNFTLNRGEKSLYETERMLEKIFLDLRLVIGLHEQEDERSLWEITASTNTWSHQRRKRRRARDDSDEPKEKKGDQESSDVHSKNESEPFLVFSVNLRQTTDVFHLELGYLEGVAGKDGVNQVLQYIKNNYIKYF